MAMDWHPGEEKMHKLMRVPEHDNPTTGMLTPQAAAMLQRAPLLAFGAMDENSRPWTTLWGGPQGFSEPLGGSMIGVKTIVDKTYDPVIDALFGERKNAAELVRSEGKGAMVGGLTIDLETRKRVKFAGRMMAGAVLPVESDEQHNGQAQSQVQLVVRVEQSLGK